MISLCPPKQTPFLSFSSYVFRSSRYFDLCLVLSALFLRILSFFFLFSIYFCALCSLALFFTSTQFPSLLVVRCLMNRLRCPAIPSPRAINPSSFLQQIIRHRHTCTPALKYKYKLTLNSLAGIFPICIPLNEMLTIFHQQECCQEVPCATQSQCPLLMSDSQ